jgi:hypothetical protein
MPGAALIVYLAVGHLMAGLFTGAAYEATGETRWWTYIGVFIVTVIAWPYVLWRVLQELQ